MNVELSVFEKTMIYRRTVQEVIFDHQLLQDDLKVFI